MELKDLFTYGFTPVFLLFPLVLTLIVRARPDGDLVTYRRRLRWLVLCTLAAELMVVAVWLIWSPPAAQSLWALFFVLWFPLAMPALVAKNPAWGGVHDPERTARSATLVPRDREMPSVRWAVWTAWTIWSLALAAILLRLLQPLIGGGGWRFGLAVGIHVLLCAWTPLLVRFAARKIGEEPEPLDTEGSAGLREAYRKHRQTKATGMAALMVAMTGLASVTLVLVAWIPHTGSTGRTLGLVLGSAGALVGVAGGVFGTWMSFQRARVAGLLRDIEAQQAAKTDGRVLDGQA